MFRAIGVFDAHPKRFPRRQSREADDRHAVVFANEIVIRRIGERERDDAPLHGYTFQVNFFNTEISLDFLLNLADSPHITFAQDCIRFRRFFPPHLIEKFL